MSALLSAFIIFVVGHYPPVIDLLVLSIVLIFLMALRNVILYLKLSRERLRSGSDMSHRCYKCLTIGESDLDNVGQKIYI